MSFHDFQDTLEKNNDKYKTSTINNKDDKFDEIQDGTYGANVIGAEFCLSKTQQKKQIKVIFRIDGPTHTGRQHFQYYGLEDENGLKFLKWLISSLGLKMEELTQLTEIKEEMIGKKLFLKVSTKDGKKRYWPEEIKEDSPDYSLEPQVPF